MKDRTGRELTGGEVISKSFNRIKSILLDVELMFLRWVGHIPSHIIRLYIYRMCGMQIPYSSRIHMWANFFYPPNISIGSGTVIGDHVFLDGRAKLVIGNHVDIASEVKIYNSHHDVHDEHFGAIERPVIIHDYVFIGPRAIILPGVTLGKGSVVAAGAVVTKDVPELTIVGGIPAIKIGERKNKDPHYKIGRARLFQ
jgi:acetyltransferase-like isoleucine patch superfamily enzyme